MRIRKTRNVSLTPDLEGLVDCEVVHPALWLLDEQERRGGGELKSNQGDTDAR